MSNYGMSADFKCRSRQGITRKRVTMQYAMHKHGRLSRAPIKKINHYQNLPLVTKDRFGGHRSKHDFFIPTCNGLGMILARFGLPSL
jgi:hypothetical protein